jgi:hypothetical protein
LLLTIDLHENLIKIKSVAISMMSSFKLASILSTELDTPEPNGLVTDSNVSLCKQIFNITMTQIETLVEPNCVTDNLGWEPMAFVGIHPPILSVTAS